MKLNAATATDDGNDQCPVCGIMRTATQVEESSAAQDGRCVRTMGKYVSWLRVAASGDCLQQKGKKERER